MAIACPECGRHYDVTQFEFGRTIQCTCGARVGMEHRARPLAEPHRFAADAMLGRLARWLRALGYDVAYDSALDDGALVRLAFEERRTLLTRDRRLCEEWRIRGCVVVDARRPAGQLREVAERFGLDRDWQRRLFTRCMVCNTPLENVAEEAVEHALPGGPHAPEGPFAWCPACGRIYWEGQHTRRMRRFLDRVFEEGRRKE